jgi:PIN domain nuclease of toxin-antitoxin system
VSRVLLDTHALLWFLFDDARLSKDACRLIEDTAIEKLLSVATLWEITIKVQLAKLTLGISLEQFFEEIVARPLVIAPIEMEQLLIYERLPLHHRDPFDRLIISQATQLRVPVISKDPAFRDYEVDLTW